MPRLAYSAPAHPRVHAHTTLRTADDHHSCTQDNHSPTWIRFFFELGCSNYPANGENGSDDCGNMPFDAARGRAGGRMQAEAAAGGEGGREGEGAGDDEEVNVRFRFL